MEKANPYWQPILNNKKGLLKGGADASVQSGRKSVGFNDYLKFQNFYEQTPKAYKSSGNYNPVYLNANELRKLNKENFPALNYDKNDYNNSGKNMDRSEVKVNESIKKVVKSNFPRGQLTGGAFKKLSLGEKALHDKVVQVARKMGYVKPLNGGKFDIKKIDEAKFKKALKITKKMTKYGSKIALPLLGAAVAQSLGIPAPAGMVLGKVAADVLGATLLAGQVVVKKQAKGGALVKRKLKPNEQELYDNMLLVAKVDLEEMQGGKSGAVDKFKEGFKSMASVSGKPIAKHSLPYIGELVAAELGIPLKVGHIMGKIAGDVIGSAIDKKEEKKKEKKSGGVGEYQGGKAPSVPKAKAKSKAKPVSGDSRQKRRGALIKKLMKDKNMKMTEASSYIKNNKLEY
jgi:hypothetical protein